MKKETREAIRTIERVPREQLAELRTRAQEKIREISSSLQEQGHQAVESGRDQIRKRPLAIVLGAFAAGLLIDRMIRKS